MRIPSHEYIEFLREQYPAGTRIRLNSMGSDPCPVPDGTEGTIQYIDDMATVHMKWDNGRTLGLCMDEDSFSVIPQEQIHELKLFMPLTADTFGRDEYGDLEDYPGEMGSKGLRLYGYQVKEAIEGYKEPEEAERGLMHYYHEDDSVNRKVKSAEFDVEERGGSLWGVCKCKVAGELTESELATLTDYITGQASDGWGEGFEQQDIEIPEGILNVHLWNSSKSWFMKPEAEVFGGQEQSGLQSQSQPEHSETPQQPQAPKMQMGGMQMS